MKINPNCFNLLEDFFVVEDQHKLLKECFDLTEEDWNKAFQLISDHGCSEEYELQFYRYYQGWRSSALVFFNPAEWVNELRDKLLKDKSDDEIVDIEDDCQELFDWHQEFSSFNTNVLIPLWDIHNSALHMNDYLSKCMGIKAKPSFDNYKFKKSFLDYAADINKKSNTYQTT